MPAKRRPARLPETPGTGIGSLESMTTAEIPGHGQFFLMGAALEMVGVFGGALHCYLGSGGCRKQGLYFSRTLPRKSLRCTLRPARAAGPAQGAEFTGSRGNWPEGPAPEVSVSHDLAPMVDGAVLDFGTYNKMQRFVWLSLPAVKGPQCSCLRSAGAPAGKRSPCLDDEGVGLTDL